MSVKENILALKKTLPAQVTLVAVSKTKPNALVLEAYEAGQRDFGENYVQELVDKQEQLPKDIRWHFIGHLQSNKVKFIAPFVHLIHGIDSFKLLQEINKQALKNNRVINCLLQLYIAQEETKFGLSFDECKTLLQSDDFKQLKNISVIGFMGMASNTDREDQIRNEFHALKQFANELASPASLFHLPAAVTLSFGMSSDYQLAIEEGSTMVRIGSSIFGGRTYPAK